MLVLHGCTGSVQYKHDKPNDTLDSLFSSYQEQCFTNVKTFPEQQLDSLFLSGHLSDDKYQAWYYYLKMYIARHLRQNPELVISYVDSILLIAQHSPSDPFLWGKRTDALFNKADMYQQMSNYRLAYYYFLEAKKSGRQASSSDYSICVDGDYEYFIGMILYKQEKFEEASRSFLSSYKNLAFCAPTRMLRLRREELLNNIALCYSKLKKYDTALFYFDSAYTYTLHLKAQEPDTLAQKPYNAALGVIAGNRARIYYHQGDTNGAIRDLEFNIAVNLKKDEDMHDALTSATFLTEIHLNKGDLAKADYWLSKAKPVADSLPDIPLLCDIYKLRWKYFRALHRYDSAEKYASLYTTLNDSLAQKARLLQNADVQQIIDQIEREYEMSLLKKDAEQRKKYLYLVNIAVILSVIVVIVVTQSWIKSKKKNKELHFLNDEVTVINKELKKLNDDKSRIMALVAHDLRNPISAISTLNAVLKENLPPADHDQKEIIEMIEAACNTSLHLVSEIMLMSSVNAQRTNEHKEKIRLNEFLHTTINLLQLNVAEKQQRLILELPEQEQELFIAAEEIRRVIANLVINASKFSAKGSNIYIKSVKADQYVLISVKDNGIGIPAEMQSKIFDMFTAARRPGTAGETPFGLGLSIAREIVEAHKGKIWVESEVGKGTTFFIQLPLNT